MQRVNGFRVAGVVIRSWMAFLIGAILLGSLWYGCYWLVDRYAPKAVSYFWVGGIGAAVVVALLLVFNEPLVVISMGAKRVRKREDAPKLWDVMCRVAPWHAGSVTNGSIRMYVVPESGMNAFAFGWGIPYMSAVGATTGIVDALDESELAAVMAHEVGHIINKDILISMFLTLCVMTMAFTGYLLIRLGPYSSNDNRSSSKGNKNDGASALLAVLLVGFLLYLVGRVFGTILQAFVSRQREYAADAFSAGIVGSSAPMISALEKVVRNPRVGRGPASALVGFLCTADPVPDDVLATHPNLQNRIASLRSLG